MKNVVLELSHILIIGDAHLVLWSGEEGTIEFKSRVPITAFSDPENDLNETLGVNHEVIKPYIHDSGYGCQSVQGAYDILVSEVYGGGDDCGGYERVLEVIDEIKL